MAFIDSHCHLDFSDFSEILPEIFVAANQQSVTQFVVPSISTNNFDDVLALAKQYEKVHPALGMHPCFMQAHAPGDIEILKRYATTHNLCAIGEIGLDYFIEKDSQARALQLRLFEAQMSLALALNLPVLLHVRKAHDQVLSVLKKLKFKAGGIAHAFNGSAEQAARYTQEFGFKLGFGGAITHPRATKLRKLVAALPLTDIVFETDAPDMPLVNMLESYNQPANISTIFDVVCSLREESAQQIEEQVELNTRLCLKL